MRSNDIDPTSIAAALRLLADALDRYPCAGRRLVNAAEQCAQDAQDAADSVRGRVDPIDATLAEVVLAIVYGQPAAEVLADFGLLED
jgi:hypothetical protein